MRTLLICPAERTSIAELSQELPLAHVPALGQTLLEYWLSALALEKAGPVGVLAHTAAELTSALIGQGERWGLNARVIPESRELTPAEALLKYAAELEAPAASNSIILLDRFPGPNQPPLFGSYQDWYHGLRRWIPSALTPDRVGTCEARSGCWIGCHSHLAPTAKLYPPCWIGRHVFVGAGAIIGPGTILEDGAFVEPGAELVETWVGPETFVGQCSRLQSSLAWGSTLANWQSGSVTRVADRFLLCALRQPRRQRTLGWLRKLSDIYSRNKGEVGMLWKHLLLHKEG